jgi:hypothetical protein
VVERRKPYRLPEETGNKGAGLLYACLHIQIIER